MQGLSFGTYAREGHCGTAKGANKKIEIFLSQMTALRNSPGTVILHKFTGLKLGKKQKMRKPIDSSWFPHYNGNRKE